MSPHEIEARNVVDKIIHFIEELKKEHPKIICHHIIVAFLEEELGGIGVQGHTDSPKIAAQVFSQLISEQADSWAKEINKKLMQ